MACMRYAVGVDAMTLWLYYVYVSKQAAVRHAPVAIARGHVASKEHVSINTVRRYSGPNGSASGDHCFPACSMVASLLHQAMAAHSVAIPRG
eukprot:1548659-Amphidinium_carterae.1